MPAVEITRVIACIRFDAAVKQIIPLNSTVKTIKTNCDSFVDRINRK